MGQRRSRRRRLWGEVLVTGATGFLGCNLVPVLVESGWTVRALCRRAAGASELAGLGALPVHGDLFDVHALRTAMSGVQAVVHAAADTAVWPAHSRSGFRVNVEGTRSVLQAAGAERVDRIVHVGSANSFGPAPHGGQTDERTPFRGGRYGLGYIVSKQQAQQVALRADPPAVVVNPTFLFGANDRVPGPGRLIQQLGRSPAVCPFPAGRGRNVAGVGTVCRGVERALRHGVPGECYVLGGVNLSYRTLFQLICGVTASRTRPVPLPGWVIRAAGTAGSAAGRLTGRDPGLSLPLARVACESFHYSSAKAARDLGYLPDDVAGIERAIRASFEWFRRTGRIAPRARGRPPSDAARAVFYDSS